DAGEFGNGAINNADVVAVFRASLLPDQRPPADSDLFSAMDAAPEDVPPACGGNGTIANSDVVACFRRSLLPLPRSERTRGPGLRLPDTAVAGDRYTVSVADASGTAPGGEELRLDGGSIRLKAGRRR